MQHGIVRQLAGRVVANPRHDHMCHCWLGVALFLQHVRPSVCPAGQPSAFAESAIHAWDHPGDLPGFLRAGVPDRDRSERWLVLKVVGQQPARWFLVLGELLVVELRSGELAHAEGVEDVPQGFPPTRVGCNGGVVQVALELDPVRMDTRVRIKAGEVSNDRRHRLAPVSRSAGVRAFHQDATFPAGGGLSQNGWDSFGSSPTRTANWPGVIRSSMLIRAAPCARGRVNPRYHAAGGHEIGQFDASGRRNGALHGGVQLLDEEALCCLVLVLRPERFRFGFSQPVLRILELVTRSAQVRIRRLGPATGHRHVEADEASGRRCSVRVLGIRLLQCGHR